MSKGNRGTTTNRRASKPLRLNRTYKPVPVIAEKYHGKSLTDDKVKLSLMARLKEWGSRIRRLFGRKKKRRIETKSIQSTWRPDAQSQEARDLGRHKAKIKARNRQRRKDTRTLHQSQRRAS